MEQTASDNQPALYQIRLLILVQAIAALAAGLVVFAEQTWIQAVLCAVPVCVGLGSVVTIYQLARQGTSGSAMRQIVILLIIEFVFVPLATVAAVIAYFAEV